MILLALRRLGFALVTLWFAATLVFLLTHLAPGGPAMALGGESGAPGYAEEIARAYGLDRSLPAIYASWLSRLARGDWGHSYRTQESVISLIAGRLPVTLALMAQAIGLATWLGTALGLRSAGSKRRWRGLAGWLAALYAVPSYVTGHALVLLLALTLGLFPVQGPGALPAPGQPIAMAGMVDVVHHFFLPVLTLTLGQLAFAALIVQARAQEELARPYIVTARAKGAGDRRTLLHHVLPNVALPVLVLLGWRLGNLIGGAVVIETVFALPGLGRLAVTSAAARDHPVVVGIVLFASFVMVSVNMVVDALACRLDPRLIDR